MCKPPALVSCLAHWLTEAGLDKLAGVKDEALRLVRTVRYANTYYLGVEDGEAPITIETVWAIEAALNRFLLVSEAFGDRASMATEADCARWDAYLLETVAAQRPVMDGPADCACGRAGGRMERAVRDRGDARAVAASGAFGRVDALRRGGGGGGVRSEGSGRVAHAVVGVGGRKAAGCRRASAIGTRRRIATRCIWGWCWLLLHSTLRLESDASTSWRGRARTRRRARATKVRESFRASRLRGRSCRRRSLGKRTRRSDASRMRAPATRCRRMRRAGRSSMWRRPKRSRTSTPFRRTSCVCRCRKWSTGRWRTDMRVQLGAERCKDMRITFHAARRRMAEGLADEIVRASSTADAIRLVRAAQEEAAVQDDDRTVASCTRLMAALAEGEIGLGDQKRSGGALPRRGSVPCGARTCSVVVYERRPGDGGAGAHRCRRGSGGP